MIIGGKKYTIPELTFNRMCELENMGVSLSEIKQKPLFTVRGFLALAIGDAETAGLELEEHLKNGGDLEDIMAEIVRSVNESGFFQALSAKTKEPTEKSTGK